MKRSSRRSNAEIKNEDGGDVPQKRRLTLNGRHGVIVNGLCGVKSKNTQLFKYTKLWKVDAFPSSGVLRNEGEC
jgi:hypothetical protein